MQRQAAADLATAIFEDMTDERAIYRPASGVERSIAVILLAEDGDIRFAGRGQVRRVNRVLVRAGELPDGMPERGARLEYADGEALAVASYERQPGQATFILQLEAVRS